MTKHEGEGTCPRSYHYIAATPSWKQCMPIFPSSSIYLRLHRPPSFRDSLFSMFGPLSELWAINRLTKVPLPWTLSKWPVRTPYSDICFAAITGDEIKAQHRADGPFPHSGWHTLGSPCIPEMLRPAGEEGSMTNSSESTIAVAGNVSNSSIWSGNDRRHAWAPAKQGAQ